MKVLITCHVWELSFIIKTRLLCKAQLCRAQSVHILNEQCECDISENASTMISCYHPPHQHLCAHGGGLEKPSPEFALSWQGKCLIRAHTPLLVTLPASPAQHATLWFKWFGGWGGVYPLLSFLPFAECAAMFELQLKCVTDLIRRVCFRGGGCSMSSVLTRAQRWPCKVVRCLLHGATFCWALSYTWHHIKRN